MAERAGPYRLVWTKGQVEAALGEGFPGETLLPVTPAALGTFLRAGLAPARDPLDYLEMPVDWRALDDEAMTGAGEVLASLAPAREEAAKALNCSLLEVEALDLWLLYLWFREFLHLRGVVQRLTASAPTRAILAAPLEQGTLADLRARWIVDCVLADLGQLESVPALHLPATTVEHLTFPEDARRDEDETILVSAFGQPDIGGLLGYLRRRRKKHPVLMLCEEEFSHHEHLSRQLERYRERFGEIGLAGPGMVMEPFRPDLTPSGAAGFSSISEAMAEAIRQHYWPRRARIEQAVRATFERRMIREAIVSDHIGDAAMAIVQQVRIRGAKLRVVAHSGLPMHPAFRLPLSGLKRGALVVSTRARAQIEARAFSNEGVGLAVKVKSPPAFHISPVERLRKRIRAWRGGDACHLGLLVTSGQFAFAPDRPIGPMIERLRALLHTGSSAGFSFTCRLREHEDDPDVLRRLVDMPTGMDIEFERVGAGSLTRFFARCHAVIEIGCPTSASLAAIAQGVPVFRLSPFEASTRWEPMPLCLIWPEDQDLRGIRDVAFSTTLRQRHLRRQRKLLA